MDWVNTPRDSIFSWERLSEVISIRPRPDLPSFYPGPGTLSHHRPPHRPKRDPGKDHRSQYIQSIVHMLYKQQPSHHHRSYQRQQLIYPPRHTEEQKEYGGGMPREEQV